MKIDGLTGNIQGIIFDMDGLLVNSESLYWQANIKAAEESGIEIPHDSYLTLTGSDAETMDQFYRRYFPTKKSRDYFIKRTDELVWKWTDQGKLRLKKGVQHALDDFQAHDVKMAIASSNYRSVVEHVLWTTGTRQYFSFFLSWDDIQEKHLATKPAPDIYLWAAQKLQLPKEKLIVFEDSSTGITAAYQASIKSVMVPDLKPPTQIDYDHAALIVSDFDCFLEYLKE